LFLKGKKKVIGVESVPDAIKDAKTIQLTILIIAEFYVGDMRLYLTMILSLNMDILMLSSQTPRDGMHKIETNYEIAPEIVYVSCNSATRVI
jgi:23S rRNA (uracil1939-C5)-methyltransferase